MIVVALGQGGGDLLAETTIGKMCAGVPLV